MYISLFCESCGQESCAQKEQVQCKECGGNLHIINKTEPSQQSVDKAIRPEEIAFAKLPPIQFEGHELRLIFESLLHYQDKFLSEAKELADLGCNEANSQEYVKAYTAIEKLMKLSKKTDREIKRRKSYTNIRMKLFSQGKFGEQASL